MKWQATITRDIIRHIKMGPLIMAPLGIKEMAGTHEIAPARIVEIPAKAGEVRQFKTKKTRDAFIAAINAEHEGAAIPA